MTPKTEYKCWFVFAGCLNWQLFANVFIVTFDGDNTSIVYFQLVEVAIQ